MLHFRKGNFHGCCVPSSDPPTTAPLLWILVPPPRMKGKGDKYQTLILSPGKIKQVR